MEIDYADEKIPDVDLEEFKEDHWLKSSHLSLII